ncbi:MAG: glycoside hydrolase family 3 protein [Lachnospiraceae bacterium]|nr:glycoside hydrolase family 3 protein [Lachnospiraceae bacterium]
MTGGAEEADEEIEIEVEEDEEIEDEDEDEEDDDDDIEDEDEEEEEDEEDRRAYRRRRRIRNQIIVYLVIIILAAGAVAGGLVVGKRVASVVGKKRQEAELMQEQAEAESSEEEEVIIDTPEPVEEEPEEEDFLGELARSYFSEMPVEDKVAGLFMITPEALTGAGTATRAGEATQEALNQYAVGGLIYFGNNIQDKEQITTMLANTVTMSRYPIFLAVDEEGGDVSRVANSKVEVTKVDDMATIGAGGDTSQAYEAGANIGSYLKELGFNVDFAPVADVTMEGEESALGNRSFGSDPQLVGAMVTNVVNGIEGADVSSCLKHFPGLGSTSADTHEGRVEIDKTLDELRAADFVPFQQGIEAGVDFVMVSHVTAPALDEESVPSSLSKKVITDILRGELGFEGVVITDALDMNSITDYYTPGEAAVMALEAGADMLLMPEDFEEAYQAVLSAVQEGTISEERLDESLERIYRVKCADKLEN